MSAGVHEHAAQTVARPSPPRPELNPPACRHHDRRHLTFIGTSFPSFLGARSGDLPEPSKRIPVHSAPSLTATRLHALSESRLRCRFSRGGQRRQVPLGVSMTMTGYFRRCHGRSSFARGGSLVLDLLVERLRDRAQAGPTQCLDRASALSRQGRAQGQMHQGLRTTFSGPTHHFSLRF